MKPSFIPAATVMIILSPPLPAAERVTLESLLAEMVDYSAIARWPEPEFTSHQATSHDRRTVSADQPGWFANDDHTQFIREETNQGRKERVMMETKEAGCLTRFWLTTVQNKSGTLRIYLDGSEEPVLVFPAYDLLSGDMNLPQPLAIPHPGYSPKDNGGNTLMLPIPFAKGCKVTWEEKGAGPRYYQINWRGYPAGTTVESYSPSVLERARPVMRKAAEALLSPPEPEGTRRELSIHLQAGEEKAVDLPPGPGSLREIKLRVIPRDARQMAEALRALIVKIEFDGEPTVWCPAGDFFGSGAGLNELRSFYRTITADGTMTCRWTMPYEKKARISLLQAGKDPVQCELSLTAGSWKWDPRSMKFHAAWHHEGGLSSAPPRDWNFVGLKGRGVYAGDTLSLYNPVATWYGEGDEKIHVDGEKTPSHIGTGTEDYYGYSFAPRGIMQTPFSNQTRVDEAATQGHNVLTRTRNLDGIPFRKSLDFDIELISWKPTRMIYSATTYWYAFDGGSSNRKEDREGALARIPTLEDARKGPEAFDGAIEAETLEVTDMSKDLVRQPQDMGDFGGIGWSRGAQLLGKGRKEGDFVVVRIPAEGKSPRELSVAATKAPDYGKLSFTVNGKRVKEEFDGYAEHVTPASLVSLGKFTPEKGHFDVKIEVSGANPEAKGDRYFFGVDYFTLGKE